MDREETIDFIKQNPLVPVYHSENVASALNILQASYDAGLRVFEFTCRGSNAIDVFGELKKHQEKYCPDMQLGIGTITTAYIAQIFIDMGAHFIVQPGIVAEVGEVCDRASITWIPGVMTPTEIYMAEDLGAEIVKIFPANILGSAYVKALRGPMPDLNIMVTGGIEPTEASLKEWFAAGANVLGLGSQLFKNMDDIETFKTNINNLLSLIKP